MTKINLKQIKKIIERTRPGVGIESKVFDTAVLLYCSVFTGPDISKLAKATKLSRSFIGAQSRIFFDLGIWAGNKVIADWTDPTSGNSMFWTDVLAVCKKLPRLPDDVLNSEI